MLSASKIEFPLDALQRAWRTVPLLKDVFS
jgi:hypothetical protein